VPSFKKIRTLENVPPATAKLWVLLGATVCIVFLVRFLCMQGIVLVQVHSSRSLCSLSNVIWCSATPRNLLNYSTHCQRCRLNFKIKLNLKLSSESFISLATSVQISRQIGSVCTANFINEKSTRGLCCVLNENAKYCILH